MKLPAILILCVCATLNASGLDASAIYQQHCAQCHGDALQGGNAKSLIDGLWQFGDKRDQINSNIKSGITPLGMPAYENTLSDQQIKELTAYILDTQKSSGIEKPPIHAVLRTHDYDVHVEVWADGLEAGHT